MGTGERKRGECPVGEAECPRLDELERAQEQIATLSRQVHVDSLTGLFNYRHLLVVAEQELERTRRTGRPTALIMVDLDHFKRVNDEWGHEAGNEALKHCAVLMRQVLRKVDIPCRYGGEEFALLLPATELPHAVAVADRLRRAIEGAPVEYAGISFQLTASMGVEVCGKGDELTSGQLLERADELLYQAKLGGRNRVCHREYELLKPRGQVSRDEKDELMQS
ncbi:MAG: GGDEF domain-containing protein [Gammaproteobacteria bacterium]|nr:GGDEF domain-containing protein [Gammaproteobacteria bacterium]